MDIPVMRDGGEPTIVRLDAGATFGALKVAIAAELQLEQMRGGRPGQGWVYTAQGDESNEDEDEDGGDEGAERCAWNDANEITDANRPALVTVSMDRQFHAMKDLNRQGCAFVDKMQFEYAVEGRDAELVRLMIQTDLLPHDWVAGHLCSPICAAMYAGMDNVRFMGSAEVDVNAKLADEKTALMVAAGNGDRGICNELVVLGASVHMKTNYGMTPLMFAATQNHPLICADILRHGAHVDQKNNSDQTALKLAAELGLTRVCRVLLDNGANPNYKTIYGWSALMHAAQAGRSGTCGELLRYGADVHAKDKRGWTPLIAAASRGRRRVCADFLAAGADACAATSDGETAWSVARDQGHDDVCALLQPVEQ